MRILALETDSEKIKQRFCHEGEEIVLFTYYHGLSFLFAIMKEICVTLVLLSVLIVSVVYQWPMVWVIPILLVLWMVFAFFGVVKSYIDWAFDFIIITTDKLILVDQTSVIKQEIQPIHIENIGGISTESQFWDIFPFGALVVHLKEGRGGKDVTLKYVPRYSEVGGVLSDVVTQYQRRQYRPDEGSPTPVGNQQGEHHYMPDPATHVPPPESPPPPPLPPQSG